MKSNQLTTRRNLSQQIQALKESGLSTNMESDDSLTGMQLIKAQRENRALLRVSEDIKLRSLDLSKYDSLESLVWHIGTQGSAIQKMAISQALSFEDCFSFASLKSSVSNIEEGYQIAVTFIEQSLENLADYFGTEVKGDSVELSWIIYENFGYLTIADFLKFFQLCKTNEFKDKTQHINARGINADFMIDFLKKYTEKREAANQRIIEESRAVTTVDFSSEFAAKFTQIAKKNKVREMLLSDKESSLREQMKEQERQTSGFKKLVDFFMNEIFAILEPEAGAVKLENKALQLAESLVERWQAELNLFENSEVDAASYMKKQSSRLMRAFRDLFDKSVVKYIAETISQYAKQNQIQSVLKIMEVFELETEGKEDSALISVFCWKFAKQINETLESNHKHHRETLLSRNELPLTKREYILKRSRALLFNKLRIDRAVDFLKTISKK